MPRRRHYNPAFAPPIRSRRQREDEATERDIQSAARNARYIEAQEARATTAAPDQEQHKPQGEQKHD